jgi:hypothetical protein
MNRTSSHKACSPRDTPPAALSQLSVLTPQERGENVTNGNEISIRSDSEWLLEICRLELCSAPPQSGYDVSLGCLVSSKE